MCSIASQLGLEHLVPTLVDYRYWCQYWLAQICTLYDVVRDEAKRLLNIILSGGMYNSRLRKVGQGSAQKKDIGNFSRRLCFEIQVF